MSITSNMRISLVFLLIIIAIVSTVILIRSPLNSDDLTLFSVSKNLAAGKWIGFNTINGNIIPNHQYYRLGILVPGAISIKLFGPNIIAYYTVSLFFIFLTFYFIWTTVKLRYSVVYAGFSICLLSLCPAFNETASNFLGDLPGSVLLLLGLYAFSNHQKPKSIKTKLCCLFFGVLLLYASYFCKLSNFVFAFIGISIILFRSENKKLIIYAACLYISLILIENIYYAHQHNISRFDVVSYHAGKWTAAEKYRSLYYVLIVRPSLYLSNYGVLCKYLLYASFILHPIAMYLNRKNFIGIVTCIGFLSIVIYVFGFKDISGGKVQPFAISSRYFILFILSSVFTYVFFISKMISALNNHPKCNTIVEITTIIALVCLCLVFADKSWNKYRLLNPNNSYNSFFEFIKDYQKNHHSDKFVYTGKIYQLRGMILFDSIPFYGFNLTYSKEASAEYLLISISRAYATLRLKAKFRGQKKFMSKKELLAQLSNKEGYRKIFVNRNFLLLKKLQPNVENN